jgi:hypothetical protein
MNTSAVGAEYGSAHQGTTIKSITGGAILEGIGGIAVIALAIVGLAGIFSGPMAAIATIVLGAAVLVEGGTFAASHREVISGPGNVSAMTVAQSEGLSGEFLGATAGIILGILALLGAAPVTLVSVAVLVFGATFAASGLLDLAASTRVVFGLAGFVLGLLAVCGLGTFHLALIGLLCLGASTLFSGARTSAAMVNTSTQ